jgi:hypothetical protein
MQVKKARIFNSYDDVAALFILDSSTSETQSYFLSRVEPYKTYGACTCKYEIQIFVSELIWKDIDYKLINLFQYL